MGPSSFVAMRTSGLGGEELPMECLCSPEWASTTFGSVAASCAFSLALAQMARTPALAFLPRHSSVYPAWHLPRSNPSPPSAPAHNPTHVLWHKLNSKIWVLLALVVGLIDVLLLQCEGHLHPLDSSNSSSSIIGHIYSGPLFFWQSLFIVRLLTNIMNTHI